MKIGVSVGKPPQPPAVWVDVAHFAKEAERLGFDSVWVGEHVTSPVHCESYSPNFPGGQVPGFHDPMISLARASAVTSRVKLGTGVILVPEHHPVELAKAIATLDLFSGGRFLFGVGSGWNKEERAILGGDPDRPWAQTREAVLAMKELWTNEVAEFHGAFYDFPPVRCFPPPASKPHPPVHLGGRSQFVIKRMVEWGDGWVGHRTTPEELEGWMGQLRDAAREAGRDPDSFEISMSTWEPTREQARQYEEAGAHRLIVHAPGLSGEQEATAHLEHIAEVLSL